MQLRRQLNLFDATMLVVGNTVGAGIFTTAGFVAGELTNPWLFAGIWVVGGFLTLCGALTYAEMTSMFPRSGGDYLYLRAAYGPWAGFLLGWICLWVINPGSIAVLTLGLVKYLTGFPGVNHSMSERCIALIIIISFSVVNYRSVRLTGTTENLWTIGSLVILLLFITGGLISGKGDWRHFAGNNVGSSGLPASKLFGPAMIAVVFSYSGWFVTTYIGDEVKRPELTLPLSLVIGTAIIVLLYVGINVTYLYALPLRDLKGVMNVGQVAGERLLGGHFVQIVTLAIMLAIAASINATILAGPRLTYALAKDGLFWSHFAKLHDKYSTPYIALLVQTILACLYVWVDTFENLLRTVVLMMLLSSIGSGLALLILRLKVPSMERPYKAWGYPYITLLFVAAYVYIAVQAFLAAPLKTFLGVAMTLSGIPVYFYGLRKRRALPPRREAKGPESRAGGSGC